MTRIPMTFSTERSRTPRYIRGDDGVLRDNPEWVRESFAGRIAAQSTPSAVGAGS